jgi:hypothetical protein
MQNLTLDTRFGDARYRRHSLADDNASGHRAGEALEVD